MQIILFFQARMTAREFVTNDESAEPEFLDEDQGIREMLDSRDDDGKTALHLACQEGHLAVAQMLVAYGSDLELVDHEGHTPQSLAAQNGRANILEFLATLSAASE